MIDMLVNFKLVAIEASEAEELILKLAKWFQVIFKRDDFELRFWQLMTCT